MYNTIKIRNFLIFKDEEIIIRRFTVLIGPHASGKSIVAKLIYFFQQIPERLSQIFSYDSLQTLLTTSFVKIFPEYAWSENNFFIEYSTSKGSISITHQANADLQFEFSAHYQIILSQIKELKKEQEKLKDKILSQNLSSPFISNDERLLSKLLSIEQQDWGFIVPGGKHLYIPAGRSFYATLQNNFFTLSDSISHLDYFLRQFGIIYEGIKLSRSQAKEQQKSERFDQLCNNILNGKYVRLDNLDYIQVNEAPQTPIRVSDCSSGQQELLPILMSAFNSSAYPFLTIEEPEAHIYPKTQYDLLKLLVCLRNSDSGSALLLTTHSPYILTGMNNMAYAGLLATKLGKKHHDKLEAIYSERERIPANELSAYLLLDGKASNIVQADTSLISADDLDEISNTLNDKFSDLLTLSQELTDGQE